MTDKTAWLLKNNSTHFCRKWFSFCAFTYCFVLFINQCHIDNLRGTFSEEKLRCDLIKQ